MTVSMPTTWNQSFYKCLQKLTLAIKKRIFEGILLAFSEITVHIHCMSLTRAIFMSMIMSLLFMEKTKFGMG